MESYNYVYQPPFPPMCPPEGYPDRGDGFGEYYGMGPMNSKVHKRRSRSNQRRSKHRVSKRSRSGSRSKSATSERSQSRSRSRSRTRSRSRSGSHSESRSSSRQKDTSLREPGFLDAFRVLYLTPRKHKKNTAKYLATKKRQDRIQEILKSDGLGSKRWRFYPRSRQSETVVDAVETRNCDQRVKIDGDFFRKYKRSRKVDSDAPIAKLKRWELIFYKKLGFIQAV